MMQGENGERKRGARDAAVSGFSSDSVVRGKEGKRGGLCGRGHAEKEDEGRGGPSMAVGSAGRLAMAPRSSGAGDAVWRLTHGPERDGGPGVSGGVWERAGERDQVAMGRR
jgi:hypothetical protein